MHFFSLFTFLTILHVLIIIGMSIRIITLRLPVTVSLAWLILVFFLPLVGAAAFLVLGEKRLGRKYTERTRAIWGRYRNWLHDLPPEVRSDPQKLSPEARALSRLTENAVNIPALSGNRLELLDAAEPILQAMISDIDRARRFCHLEFYIWTEGGLTDEVGSALLRAAGRGVTCRVLLDAIGSAKFQKGQLLEQLKAGGVEVAFALPVSLISVFGIRPDLRLHRKIVVIDDAAAYTGSFNLVDPRLFKQDAGVGEWVDAMVRLEGPGVLALNALFRWDWEVETGRDLNAEVEEGDPSSVHRAGDTDVQVVPSGPGIAGNNVYQLLLLSIYSARREIVVTTPYFVPDEAVMKALELAALRGVDVRVITTGKGDSLPVYLAAFHYIDQLRDLGIKFYAYKPGFLHEKVMLVDDNVSTVGTANFDNRSFRLNFEVTAVINDVDFASQMEQMFEADFAHAELIDPAELDEKPFWWHLGVNLSRLASPVL